MKLEIEQAATPQQAVFAGVVDLTDVALPGVKVVLRDEVTKREVTAITDNQGAFTIAALNDGVYRMEVRLDGLQPAVIEHLVLKQNEITHARIAMRIDPKAMVVMGAIAVEPMTDGVSTTFSQDLINKLPL